MLTVQWSQLRSVLKDASPLLGAVGGVCVAIGLGRMVSTDPEDAVQSAGNILAAFLAFVLAADVSQTLRETGQPSFVTTIRNWCRRFLGAFRRPISGTMNVTLAADGLSASGSVAAGVGSTAPATVEQRLADVERDVRDLRAEVRSAAHRVTRRLYALERDLQREQRERQEGDRRIDETIKTAATSGIPLRMIELVWALSAAAFTILPKQVAALLAYVRAPGF